MKIILFEEVESANINALDEIDLGVLEVVSYYKEEERIFCLLKSSFEKGVLLSPSLFSSCKVKCVGCYFDRFLFLKFLDGADEFYLIQHSEYCVALWIPGCSRLYVKNRSLAAKVIDKCTDVKEVIGESVHPKEFLGLINGYKRPYHYFYERAPSLYSYLKGVGESKVKIIDREDGAFLSAEKFGVSSGNVIKKCRLNDLRGVYINPSFPVGFSARTYFWREGFDRWLTEKVRSSNLYDVGKKKPVIWIGVSQEKRSHRGFEDFVSKFVSLAATKFPDALVLFDGITSTDYYYNSQGDAYFDTLKEFVLSKVDVGEDQLVNLSGATSVEKVSAALMVDFFISSALTDSMWCAKYGKKLGLCWTGKNVNKLKKEHTHPYTFIIPPGRVYSVEGEYSLESFVFNPDAAAYFTFEGLNTALSVDKSLFVGCMEKYYDNHFLRCF